MAMAHSVEQYLNSHHAKYDIIDHQHTATSARTAEVAHIPGDKLAKAVVVGDGERFMLVVLPSTHQVDLGKVHHHYGQLVGMATEPEFSDLFSDCEPGAVPALGSAYGLKTLVDDSLRSQPDIYFEAGDHEHLIHMEEPQFERLLDDLEHGEFSHHLTS